MVNNINPADCDRTTVYTGECRNFADTEWIPFESARRRSPAARDGYTWLVDCGVGSFWQADDQVRHLVRLVPARPITREDLPSSNDVHWSRRREQLKWWANPTPDIVLDAVVAHLNARGGLGIDCREPLERALRERDELEASHEQLHREWTAEFIRATNAENERDELREALTAEKSEAELSGKTGELPTTSAVTRDEVEKAVLARRWNSAPTDSQGFAIVHVASAADFVMELLSGDDPAVFVVRESDIAAVEVERDSHGEWYADGEHVYANGAADSRNLAGGHMQKAIGRLAAARAIEAEQTEDPAEELARELATVAYPDVDFKNAIDVADAAAKAAYRAIAAFVIERHGQAMSEHITAGGPR